MSTRAMFNRMLEFLLLVIGCGVTGFFIGVLQHYVAFGLHGYGFGRDAFLLACLEGGIVGVMLGIPTGASAYYFVLRRHVSFKQVSVIVVGSLLGGCGVGVIGGPWSALLTPALTLALARHVNETNSYRLIA